MGKLHICLNIICSYVSLATSTCWIVFCVCKHINVINKLADNSF